MLNVLYVRVPVDLARELDAEGIEELEQVRSLDWLSHSATVGVTVVGAVADLTTVLLAKNMISQFAHRLVNWAVGKAQVSPGSQLTIRFDSGAQVPGGPSSTFEATFSSMRPLPAGEVAALMSHISTVFANQPESAS